MKGVELIAYTDKEGNLKFDFPTNLPNKKIKVYISFEEELVQNESEEILTLLPNIKGYEFLNHDEEDIYNVNDGEPFYGKR